MSKTTDDKQKIDAWCKQYRDWLIPATLFVGIAASIVLFILSITDLTVVLIVSASLAIASLCSFILSLFWAISRLEDIELLECKAEEPGWMFVLTCSGIFFLCLSLSVLAFWKSKAMGISISAILILSTVVLFRLFKMLDKMRAA